MSFGTVTRDDDDQHRCAHNHRHGSDRMLCSRTGISRTEVEESIVGLGGEQQSHILSWISERGHDVVFE